MARAIYNGDLVAESSDVVEVDGYLYFPARSVRPDVLVGNAFTTTCSWKGDARYYDVTVAGKTCARAAFDYPAPKQAAEDVRDRVAFWKDVVIEV